MKTPVCIVILGATTAAFAASDADLRRCRALADGAARPVCDDALPAGALPTVPAVPETPPAASFGLERAQDRVAEITSSILGPFEGWGLGQPSGLAG